MNPNLRERLARVTAARAECAATDPARFADDAAWSVIALAELRRLAREREEFEVDDLERRLSRLPEDRRAIGGVLAAGARQGVIEPAGWTPGGPRRHGRPVRRWRSKLFTPDDATERRPHYKPTPVQTEEETLDGSTR